MYLNVRLGVKHFFFQKKILLVSSKSNLGCEAGFGLTVSWSDHIGSFSDRPRIVNDVSSVFNDFLKNFGVLFFVADTIFGEVGS